MTPAQWLANAPAGWERRVQLYAKCMPDPEGSGAVINLSAIVQQAREGSNWIEGFASVSGSSTVSMEHACGIALQHWSHPVTGEL